MSRLIQFAAVALLSVMILNVLFSSSYFMLTRNGFRDGNVFTDKIIDAGNYLRSRRASANISGKLYPEMSDQEFGSRIVHSICASGAPCINKQRYRLKVWSRTPDYENAGVSFGDNLGARWTRAVVPGDRYICHMQNPYWFSCLAGSSRRTEYRFIPEGPYTPIEMWDEDGAARDR